jgi:hypothetical protein
MSTPEFEAFVARLYTDSVFRGRFLSDRRGTAVTAGLTEGQIASVIAVDAEGLVLAAKGFEKKRERHQRT